MALVHLIANLPIQIMENMLPLPDMRVLSLPARVKIVVYNSLGQEIRNLSDATYSAGVHSVRWNGLDNLGNAVPSGVYFYQMVSGTFNQVRKMMLVK